MLSTVSWPALATRAFALATVLVLARLTVAQPATPAGVRPPAWPGYVALVLALPHPVLRVNWALGGTLTLTRPTGRAEQRA